MKIEMTLREWDRQDDDRNLKEVFDRASKIAGINKRDYTARISAERVAVIFTNRLSGKETVLGVEIVG